VKLEKTLGSVLIGRSSGINVVKHFFFAVGRVLLIIEHLQTCEKKNTYQEHLQQWTKKEKYLFLTQY
jgi:hypothetical protein